MPGRAHQRQVDRRAQGQQALVGADVAGGLFAADVLLAGLQRQHPAAAAAAIDGLADQPAGHAADELLAAGHDAQVRPAEGHRVAQRLPFGHDDVGPVSPGRFEQPQADRIDRDDQQRPGLMGNFGRVLDLFQAAEEVGMLHEHAGRLGVDGRGQLGAAIVPSGVPSVTSSTPRLAR